jgi:hypothetical protein
MANSDEGWTRFLLEKYEFPFVDIHDAEMKAGGLAARFDAVVIPSMSTEAIIAGNKPGTMPSQYEGGITNEGVRNIREFVENGGTLVALNGASVFALDVLHMPVKNALAGLQAAAHGFGKAMEAQAAVFACPGSVLNMEFNVAHPVAFGMPEKGAGMFYGSTAFDLIPSFEGSTPAVIARYPAQNILASGYLAGANYLSNKAAAVDVPLGNGRVILLGFAVQNRSQPHGTFKLLFNSLFYGAMGK